MNENSAYNKLLYDAYLANQAKQQEEATLTEEQAKQRDEMVKDVRKQLAYKQMLTPAANLVDFFANTYRGGKVGGGGNISDATGVDPAISQQASMIGWMGKPKISSSGSTNPLALAKFAYQQDKDAAKKEEKEKEAEINEKEIFKLEKEFRASPVTKALRETAPMLDRIDTMLNKKEITASEYNNIRQTLTNIYQGKRPTDKDIQLNSGGQTWADQAERFINMKIEDKMGEGDVAAFKKVLESLKQGIEYTKEMHLSSYAPTAETYGISPERYEKNFVGFIKPKSESKLYKQEKKDKPAEQPASSTAPVREFVRDANGKLVEVTK